MSIVAAESLSYQGKEKKYGDMPMNQMTTLTCSTSGDELLRIGQLFRAAVAKGLVARARTTNGVEFRIRHEPDAVVALKEFVRRETACCPFFVFDVAEQGSEIRLGVEGPVEAASLLDLLYRLAEPGKAEEAQPK